MLPFGTTVLCTVMMQCSELYCPRVRAALYSKNDSLLAYRSASLLKDTSSPQQAVLRGRGYFHHAQSHPLSFKGGATSSRTPLEPLPTPGGDCIGIGTLPLLFCQAHISSEPGTPHTPGFSSQCTQHTAHGRKRSCPGCTVSGEWRQCNRGVIENLRIHDLHIQDIVSSYS